jgi:hypothetical protein
MDQVTAIFIAYFAFAAAMGVISNFQRAVVMWIASAAVVMASFLLELFAGPLMIFALFYAVPFGFGRFAYLLIGPPYCFKKVAVRSDRVV